MTQEEYLYEMATWANGERMVPEAFVGGIDNIISHLRHWHRVMELLNEGDRVLEVGCGCGLPARIYSIKTKAPVLALDKPEVVRMATLLYPTPGVTFASQDFNEPFRYAHEFDAVVCIDVIEHIQNKDVFLQSLANHDIGSTRWILSTPIGRDQNPWHIHFWDSTDGFLDDVCRFLSRERVVRI